MSAVVIATAFGGPEVLSVVDQPAGEPAPGEARIQVRAAGVNPVDWKQYSGQMGADPARLPMRLGAEASGVVTAVGPDAGGLDAVGPAGPVRVGDEVIAFRAPGAYAAEVAVPVDSLVPKPATLDWAPASGLMLAGVTGWHALAATGVHQGDTVLMHGAAGGVGLIAIQLAVARGATVIATASPARHEFLRELGAIPVAYGDGLDGRVRAAAPGGVDVALDLVGTGEALDVSLDLVADRAREAGIKLLGGAPGADPGTEVRMPARFDLAKLAGDGALRVFVARSYPLSQVADAHRYSMAGHATGKIVLIP